MKRSISGLCRAVRLKSVHRTQHFLLESFRIFHNRVVCVCVWLVFSDQIDFILSLQALPLSRHSCQLLSYLTLFANAFIVFLSLNFGDSNSSKTI